MSVNALIERCWHVSSNLRSGKKAARGLPEGNLCAAFANCCLSSLHKEALRSSSFPFRDVRDTSGP